jgi:hypothetical protein
MGRWSGLSYLEKLEKLTILTAYRSPRQQAQGGLGFFNQQYATLLNKGIKKPHVLWRSPCQAGQSLRIAVAWAQYVACTSTPILEDVGSPLPHLETKWITSLRTFLKYTGATIELDESYLTNREGEHDWHIMDAIIQSGKFSPKEIRQLNYCRLYLQATTISDIANAKGDALDVYLIKGNINHQSSSCNKWHKVNQERPADANWKLWHKATKLWSTITGKLHQPLGKWLQPISQQRRRWPAYASTTGLIFIRVSNNSTRFNQHRISQKDCEGEGGIKCIHTAKHRQSYQITCSQSQYFNRNKECD